jgi:hypothetical protein
MLQIAVHHDHTISSTQSQASRSGGFFAKISTQSYRSQDLCKPAFS